MEASEGRLAASGRRSVCRAHREFRSVGSSVGSSLGHRLQSQPSRCLVEFARLTGRTALPFQRVQRRPTLVPRPGLLASCDIERGPSSTSRFSDQYQGSCMICEWSLCHLLLLLLGSIWMFFPLNRSISPVYCRRRRKDEACDLKMLLSFSNASIRHGHPRSMEIFGLDQPAEIIFR